MSRALTIADTLCSASARLVTRARWWKVSRHFLVIVSEKLFLGLNKSDLFFSLELWLFNDLFSFCWWNNCVLITRKHDLFWENKMSEIDTCTSSRTSQRVAQGLVWWAPYTYEHKQNTDCIQFVNNSRGVSHAVCFTCVFASACVCVFAVRSQSLCLGTKGHLPRRDLWKYAAGWGRAHKKNVEKGWFLRR